MKYIILVPDGMSDRPLAELDGQTPLAKANTANMDKLAARSEVGLALTIPKGFTPGSDVANLAVMGYDPSRYYSGRGPLEAASMGIKLSAEQVAWRCNLVTVTDSVMTDFTASHISSGDAKGIMASLQAELGTGETRFYPGISYRHLCVTGELGEGLKTTPPHDIVGQTIDDYLPNGSGAETLLDLMERAKPILADHQVNQKRREEGKNEANSIWIWGGGKALPMPTIKDKYSLSGAVISAVDLIQGIGVRAGMEVVKVPGATGFFDTDYEAKAKYGLNALKDHDILYLHVEAPDEAGHMGDIDEKIKALENFDNLVVGTLLAGLEKGDEDFKILCLPDHATPVALKTHSSEPVPYFLFRRSGAVEGVSSFTEAKVAEVADQVVPAWGLLDLMVGRISI